jgi:hypothetical protein
MIHIEKIVELNLQIEEFKFVWLEKKEEDEWRLEIL